MDNSSQILETISQNISGWNPIVAEVDLLGQTLVQSCSYISEDPKEDNLRNMIAIIKEVKVSATLCVFIFLGISTINVYFCIYR